MELLIELAKIRVEILELEVHFGELLWCDLVFAKVERDGFLCDVLHACVELRCEESRATSSGRVNHLNLFLFNNNKRALFNY